MSPNVAGNPRPTSKNQLKVLVAGEGLEPPTRGLCLSVGILIIPVSSTLSSLSFTTLNHVVLPTLCVSEMEEEVIKKSFIKNAPFMLL